MFGVELDDVLGLRATDDSIRTNRAGYRIITPSSHIPSQAILLAIRRLHANRHEHFLFFSEEKLPFDLFFLSLIFATEGLVELGAEISINIRPIDQTLLWVLVDRVYGTRRGQRRRCWAWR